MGKIIKHLICAYLQKHGGSFSYKNTFVCSYKTNLSGTMVCIPSEDDEKPISDTLKKWEGYY